MSYGRIIRNIPRTGEVLAKYRGADVIDRIGEEIVKDVVTGVLCGENIRSLTEGMTRRRLTLSNAALFVTFLKSNRDIGNFASKIPDIVKTGLGSDIPNEKKLFLKWCIGLTEKGIQNVLRSSGDEFEGYLKTLEDSIASVVEKCGEDYGELTGRLRVNDMESKVDWPFVLYLFTAIGAQTLAIRGSEKSMYGKLFEKLVLGSLLTLLGFEKIDRRDTSKQSKVFWLSSRGTKRESDATLLYKPGVGVRFDIGFIGRGNTEISLDKVSRFEREMEYGRRVHYMTTIVLVDSIGDRSRIVEMAEGIGGRVVQMSMTHWIREVARILAEKIEFKHPIAEMNDNESLLYVKDRMQDVDLREIMN